MIRRNSPQSHWEHPVATMPRHPCLLLTREEVHGEWPQHIPVVTCADTSTWGRGFGVTLLQTSPPPQKQQIEAIVIPSNSWPTCWHLTTWSFFDFSSLTGSTWITGMLILLGLPLFASYSSSSRIFSCRMRYVLWYVAIISEDKLYRLYGDLD